MPCLALRLLAFACFALRPRLAFAWLCPGGENGEAQEEEEEEAEEEADGDNTWGPHGKENEEVDEEVDLDTSIGYKFAEQV